MTDETSVIKQLDFVAGTISVDSDSPLGLSALKYHYVQQARRFGEEGIDSIYFSGEFPSVYFKSVDAFTPETVQEVIRIQRKVWNQGKVPFLYVESPTEVRVYNCYEKPRQANIQNLIKEEKELCLIHASKRAEKDLQELKDVFGKVSVESGGFWQQEQYANRLDVKKRVDEALVTNIKKTRLSLRSKGLTDDIIHDLLLRSLFILYLEDRKATDRTFYEQYLPEADSYFAVLTNIHATYKLFEKLETTFNGNLCPVQQKEHNLVTIEHLDEIKRCFWSDWALSKQPVLFDEWRIFDFAYIPIQLISEIYEDFLRKEVGTEEMEKNGAFYTPHALAEFILNQVLPYPSSKKDGYNVRTLDPTCGSGIFLVDSLNRLLDRWEYAHPGDKLTFETIKQIVLDNIFGIEIEGEAIKVAAFSIYLTMLDRLDPKTLWQNNRFPYLIYDQKKALHLQGHNLFLMSSLCDGPFTDIEFDLIVGNPPFGTRNVDPEILDYLKTIKKENREYDFAKQTVIAFLYRVSQFKLSKDVKIALISTSKILFNTGKTYQNFREFFFNKNIVEKIYNFSVLRRSSEKLKGRNLFASAVAPTCVIFYAPSNSRSNLKRLTYYTPTTAIKNRLIDGIAIDPIDIKYLPVEECQKADTKIWKIAMWGTDRDFNLINKLKLDVLLSETIQKRHWKRGVGFDFFGPSERFTPSDKNFDPDIRKIPHIPSSQVNRYYSSKEKSLKIDNEHFRRFGERNAYSSPHVLIKEGQSKKRFCASYVDYDCSFKKSIFGIHSSDDVFGLKLLVGFLNSAFASYLMFLTSSNWGIERENVKSNEILSLPDLCFSLPEQTQEEIVGLVDQIIYRNKEEVLLVDFEIENLESKIEASLWKGLGLSTNDRILIEDLLTYRLGAFQDRHESEAFLSTSAEHSEAYATHLCQTINHFIQPEDSIHAWAEYFDLHRSSPLQIIILHLNEQKKGNAVEQLSSGGLNQVLQKLEEYTYKEAAESIFFRRFIRYYNDDTIYIVKPNERRFWSRSMALNDADEIILEILTSEAE